jgi:putative endonuclease
MTGLRVIGGFAENLVLANMSIMRSRLPCVYMLAGRRNGVLYVGVTSDLIQRVWQHRCGSVSSFTRGHAAYNLVWYEVHETMESAITREKLLKKWHRSWKLNLIENTNPYWSDLYPTLL